VPGCWLGELAGFCAKPAPAPSNISKLNDKLIRMNRFVLISVFSLAHFSV
jgi:hypothetical protein